MQNARQLLPRVMLLCKTQTTTVVYKQLIALAGLLPNFAIYTVHVHPAQYPMLRILQHLFIQRWQVGCWRRGLFLHGLVPVQSHPWCA